MTTPVFKLNNSRSSTNYQSSQGFTLVEIMVVLVVLSIFAAMVSVSVGTSDTQKNRAYYEHMQDTLSYIRLTSAERMQPMGIRLVTNQNGQQLAEVVRLENAYSSYQQIITENVKNSMELSNLDTDREQKTPAWVVEESINLPETPNNIKIGINTLDTDSAQSTNNNELQPWFQGQDVPGLIWFGTGQATPVSIEISYNERLVGDAIVVMPDGGLQIGKQN